MAGEELDEFLEDYDDATTSVLYARHEDFPRIVRLWFKSIEDAAGPISQRLSYLESIYSWENVQGHVLRPQSGMGNGTLEWPDDLETRLAAYIALFRRFVIKDPEGYQFAFNYFSTRTSNINDTLQSMTQALFDPAAKELRKYLVRSVDRPLPTGGSIPASDRTVKLDHNSAAFEDTVQGLDDLEQLVKTSNEIAVDPDGRERIAAEIGAGRRLLGSRTVRIAAIAAVLYSALKWLAETVAGTAVGIAAEGLLHQLLTLIPGLS